MGVLYGRAGRLTAENGGFRPAQGVKKWSVDGEKCFKYWTFLTTDCAICVQVCPYNRGNGFFDVLWKALASWGPTVSSPAICRRVCFMASVLTDCL